jgi:hypothetical protein
MKNKHENSIIQLNVFKDEGQWVFNDPDVGLIKEPFVAGADTLIEKVLPEGAQKGALTFSDNYFPTRHYVLDMVKDNSSTNEGTYYHCKELNHDLWLCPALLKYFKTPPKKIYFKIK